jgi:hypothetical protein
MESKTSQHFAVNINNKCTNSSINGEPQEMVTTDKRADILREFSDAPETTALTL